MKVTQLIKSLVSEVRGHWKTPGHGKQVPYREMAAYSVGGIGVQFIIGMVGYLALSTTSLILTVSIGISVKDLQTMTVISTVIGLLTSPLRGMIFDNTKSKAGKFRPYLLTMGLPSAALASLMVFLPYSEMSYTMKFVSVLVIYNLMNLFAPFYTNSYNSLPMVMSSNSDERTQIFSYSSVIYSLAPTITGAVVPLMGDMSKIDTYKLVIPLFSVIGLGLSLLAFFGTKERIIVSKQYVPKVKFFDALKALSINKYFWIIYGSGWLNFLSLVYGSLFNWIFILGMNKDNDKAALLSLLTLLSGTASLPGMLFAPPIIKKFGKRNVALASAFLQILALGGMALVPNSYGMVFVFMYIKNLATSISIVYTPAMKADALDYQQFRTGTRLEGMMEQIAGLLGSVLVMGTGYVMPYILEQYGLVNNYDDLRNDAFRGTIVAVVAVCTLIGTVISTVPMLFYDLSEKKHSNMIKVLRIRALFEDFGNQQLTDEELITTMEAVRSAQAIVDQGVPERVNKKDLRNYEAAQITLDELYKFEQEAMQKKLAVAKIIVDRGPLHLQEPNPANLQNAIAMPENTKDEKKMRSAAIKSAEKEIQTFKKCEKEYVTAKKLVEEFENYSRYDEIKARYQALTAVV